MFIALKAAGVIATLLERQVPDGNRLCGFNGHCCRGRRRHHGLADEEPAEQEPLHYFNTNDDYARSQIRSRS